MVRPKADEKSFQLSDPQADLAEHSGLAWAVFDAFADAIFLIHLDGTILHMNASASRRMDRPAAALIGTSIWHLIPPAKASQRKAVLNQVVKTGVPTSFVDGEGEQWNEILIHPISGADGKVEIIAICARDITRQVTAEERLKKMILQAITIQEDERRRISQDLHDDIGQSMTALILSLKAIDSAVTAGERETGFQIKDSIRIVETLIKRIRQISYELRPPSLDTMPLAKALGFFCTSFGQQTGLHVDFSSQDDLPPLSDTQATALYRLVQEGLNNTVKHARATSVWINLDHSEGGVNLSIEDNGLGFDPKAVGGSMGLRGIRDRFLMLNGSFDVESTPGKGTRLFGSLPIPAQDR